VVVIVVMWLPSFGDGDGIQVVIVSDGMLVQWEATGVWVYVCAVGWVHWCKG